MRALLVLLITALALCPSESSDTGPSSLSNGAHIDSPHDMNSPEVFQIDALVLELQLPTSKSRRWKRQRRESRVSFLDSGALTDLNSLSVSNYDTIGLTNSVGDETHGFTHLGKLGNDFESVLTVITNSGSVEMLSKPRIIVSNGVPSQLFIGTSMPYTGGIYSDHEEARLRTYPPAVVLEITPYTTRDGCARIKVSQRIETSDRLGNVDNLSVTKTKKADASAEIRTHQTIILCGGVTQVVSRRKARSELIVLLVPELGAGR
jgi:type II secretory pathway component HofQ